MREYLNPIVKADRCAQYVRDIEIGVNNATDLTRNIRVVIEWCNRKAGLKVTMENAISGPEKSNCSIGPTLRKESHLKLTMSNFSFTIRASQNRKLICSVTWVSFLNDQRLYMPRMAGKFNLFCKLLKAEASINITLELKETFDSVNKALSDNCELVVKQPCLANNLS